MQAYSLREKIAEIFRETIDTSEAGAHEWAEAQADRILAIEDIDIALRYLAQQRRNGVSIFVDCTVEQNDSGYRVEPPSDTLK